MDSRVETLAASQISIVDEFGLAAATNRKRQYDTLLHRGRRVAEVAARRVEAQFRFPDGNTLLLLNDDTEFKENLTVILINPALVELDRLQVGGAFTPGYLTSAYACSANEVCFCWHDLEQVVTIGRHTRRFGLHTGWLKLRDVDAAAPRRRRTGTPTLSIMLSQLLRRRHGRGRTLPAMVWLAWLTVRTVLFSRKPARGRAPRR